MYGILTIIYLRLVDFYGRPYHTWMLWAMSMFYWMWLADWLKLLCWISPEPEELQERNKEYGPHDWVTSFDINLSIYIYIKQICRSNLSVSFGLALTCYSQDLLKGDVFCWKSWVKRYGSILQSCRVILLDLEMWNHGPIGNQVIIDMMLSISYHKPAQYLDLLVC